MPDDRWLTAIALSSIASGVTGLLVPLYLVRLGAGAPVLGVTAALASLISAPAAILAGGYADRTGAPTRVLLGGLILAAIIAILFPILATIPTVILLNAVLAIAIATTGPAMTMLIIAGASTDTWEGRIAQLNTYQGYGGAGGLVLGFVWTALLARITSPGFAQRSLFVVAALLAVAAAVTARQSLRRGLPTQIAPDIGSDVVYQLATTSRQSRHPSFLGGGGNRLYWATRATTAEGLRHLGRLLPSGLAWYFVAGLLFFLGFGAFWAPLPLYLTTIGFTADTIFLVYLLNTLASTLCFGVAGRLSTTHGAHRLQTGALGVRGLAFVTVGALAATSTTTIALGGPVVPVAVLLMIVGVTWAIIAVAGTSIVSRITPTHRQGAVLGIYTALAAVGGSIGNLLGGVLAARSFTLAFVVAGGFVVAGAAIVGALAIYRPRE